MPSKGKQEICLFLPKVACSTFCHDILKYVFGGIVYQKRKQKGIWLADWLPTPYILPSDLISAWTFWQHKKFRQHKELISTGYRPFTFFCAKKFRRHMEGISLYFLGNASCQMECVSVRGLCIWWWPRKSLFNIRQVKRLSLILIFCFTFNRLFVRLSQAGCEWQTW